MAPELLRQKFYVKGVTYGGAAQDAAKIEVRGDRLGGLEVTLSPNVAEVHGKVTLRAAGEDVTVILTDGAAIVAEAGTDQRGRFRIPAVAPGKYWMLAIKNFDDDDWGPEVLKALGSSPVALELQESEKRQVDLRVISQN